MRKVECAEEAAVRRAARSGRWPEAARQHAADCASCAETARVVGALAAIAAMAYAEPELPDPALLWRRARLSEALEARRNATRPIRVAHTVSLATGAAALAVLAGSKGTSILAWVGSWAQQGASGASFGLTLGLTLSLVALGAVLVVATVAATGRNLSDRTGRRLTS